MNKNTLIDLPWEWYIELFALLSRKFGSQVKKLVASLSINEIIQKQHCIGSLSEHLRGEQGISVLNSFHLIVEFFIVSDNTDAPVYASLDLDGTEAEHSQGGIGRPVEIFYPSKGFGDIFKYVNFSLFQEGHNWLNVIFNSVKKSKEHCFSLNSYLTFN